jgi:YidC/Oxa1 family membrane protein insertase
MDTQRIIAAVIFAFSGFLLMEAWNKHQHLPVTAPVSTSTPAPQSPPSGTILPAPSSPLAAPSAAPSSTDAQSKGGQRIRVKTDTLSVELDTLGGDIRSVDLLKHAARGDSSRPFALMQDKVGSYYVAQSGLLGPALPNHTSKWVASSDAYDIGANNTLNVTLTQAEGGVTVEKTFVFKRGSYVIDVRHVVKNGTGEALAPNAYFQFLRDGNPPEGEGGGNFLTGGVVTYTGPAVFTDAKKFQKVDFASIAKGKQDHVREASDGWIAMVQHYFVAAWLPNGAVKREFFTKRVGETMYSAGVILPVGSIAPGASDVIDMPLYVGPQEQERLKALAPEFDLVVDYGWLKILAYPMFVVLSWIDKIVGNWGWTIVVFTILLKLVFFPLNQKAGKSMAHMKQLAPKVEALKARYGDDKVKMNQAMMELYRTEKVNPLGGCLPILIQMPFLIAMYWVLLGAVELRNTPWIGWIKDLSTPDPFYVLPVIMGASMIIQTKLNPAPPDPVQAKVMMIMPVVFSVMFFFFPAGLVLYWTVQNILGIAQQWYINKSTAHLTNPKAGGAGK